jgi:hypothetical protein
VLRFLQFLAGQAVAREVRIEGLSLATLAEDRQRRAIEFLPLQGELSIGATRAPEGAWKLGVQLSNQTPCPDARHRSRDEALVGAFCAVHWLLEIEGGQFVSLIDPPPLARDLVQTCDNRGLWPVLVGDPGTRASLLAAPIILDDYPRVAAESPGDFFDATEIDALLTLRVLTLTDEEKQEMSCSDPRARALLERTEASGLERLGALHGRLLHGQPSTELRVGARVSLHPKGRADIFDLVLEGQRATVQAIEHDLEGRIHVAVTVDDDPGKDLAAYGHRFFFRTDELEPIC